MHQNYGTDMKPSLLVCLRISVYLHTCIYMYVHVYIVQESSASELWHRYDALTASLSQDLCILTCI